MLSQKRSVLKLWYGGLIACASFLLSGAPHQALAQPPAYVQVAAIASFQGAWNTNYGPLTLRVVGDTVTGQYNSQGTIGDLRGKVSGPFVQGRWADNKYGKGSFQFVMTPDGRNFRGSWTQDGHNQAGEWNGWR